MLILSTKVDKNRISFQLPFVDWRQIAIKKLFLAIFAPRSSCVFFSTKVENNVDPN